MSWQFNLSKIKGPHMADPFGFTKNVNETQHAQNSSKKREVIESKLKQLAFSNLTQIFMNMFIMWMIGNNISIYTLIFLGHIIYSFFNTCLNINKTFSPYENSKIPLLGYKAIYTTIQLGQLAIILYKLNSLGLLPVNASDWVDLVSPHSQDDFIII